MSSKQPSLRTSLDDVRPFLATQLLERLLVLASRLLDNLLWHLHVVLALESVAGKPITQVLLRINVSILEGHDPLLPHHSPCRSCLGSCPIGTSPPARSVSCRA